MSQFNSPVEAVTTLYQQPDGRVDAELVLISIAVSPHAFVDTAKNPHVRMPDGTEIALSPTTSGHYAASSTTSSALKYLPGQTYQFKFELDDQAKAKQVAGGNFVAVMTAPASNPASFQLTKAPKFAGDTATIAWNPTSLYGVVKVKDGSGALVYSNFDFTQPQFDGSKWARLQNGGTYELGVDVFKTAGTYSVSVCTVDKVSGFDTSISAELGALSGFLIGPCAAEQSVVVAK